MQSSAISYPAGTALIDDRVFSADAVNVMRMIRKYPVAAAIEAAYGSTFCQHVFATTPRIHRKKQLPRRIIKGRSVGPSWYFLNE
jgi:hypothetical protein